MKPLPTVVMVAAAYLACSTLVDSGKPRAYPCQTTEQCPGGWRCGLDKHCHDPAVGADYLCTDDSHCEQGWRCGLDGRCVDSTGEALRPPPAVEQLAVERLSAPFFSPSISRAAFVESPTYTPPAGEMTPSGTAMAFLDGMTVRYAFMNDDTKVSTTASHVLSAAATDIAVWGPFTWVVDANGLEQLYKDSRSAIVATRPTFPALGGGQLRFTQDPLPTVLVFHGTQFATLELGATMGSGPFDKTDTFYDMASIQAQDSSSTSLFTLIASTPNGLYAAPRRVQGDYWTEAGTASATPVWRPLGLGALYSTACNGAGTLFPKRLRTGGYWSYTRVAVEVFTDAAFTSEPSIILTDTSYSGTGTDYIANCSKGGLTTPGQAYQACPAGHVLVDFTPTSSYVMTRCRAPNGHEAWYEATNDRTPSLVESAVDLTGLSVLSTTPVHGVAGFLDSQGRLVRCTLDRVCSSRMPLAPPSTVIGSTAAASAMSLSYNSNDSYKLVVGSPGTELEFAL